MINPNILKSLESNFQDPSYSVIISKFEQPEFCNKDQLKIYMEQFSPNLEHIIENNLNVIERLKSLLTENNIEIPNDIYVSSINNCIQKTFIVDSMLNYNTKDGMYISQLNGTIENDIELNTTSRLVKGTISNQKVILTQNDVPNNFNRSKFKIKDNKLIINIPKKIETISIALTKTCKSNECYDDNNNLITNCQDGTETFTEENINNNQIIIPLNLCQYTYSFALSYTIKNSILSHNIESITTPLKNKIDIDFSYKYNELPAIILTIDEDKKIYSSYTTKFTTDINNFYNGVTIEFKGLKKQKKYGDINITILGPSKEKGDINDSTN